MRPAKFTVTVPRSFLLIEFTATSNDHWKACVRNKNNNNKLAISKELSEDDVTKICKSVISQFNKAKHTLKGIEKLIINTIKT
jgi:hypothetical protein